MREVISTRAVRSVIAADGRVWNNVRIDWTIAGVLQLSDARVTES